MSRCFLLKVWQASGVDYVQTDTWAAIVDLDDEAIELYRRRAADARALAEQESFSAYSFWDGRAWYMTDGEQDCLFDLEGNAIDVEAFLGYEECVEIQPRDFSGIPSARTDCGQVRFSGEDVMWSAYDRNGPKIETASIPYADLGI